VENYFTRSSPRRVARGPRSTHLGKPGCCTGRPRTLMRIRIVETSTVKPLFRRHSPLGRRHRAAISEAVTMRPVRHPGDAGSAPLSLTGSIRRSIASEARR